MKINKVFKGIEKLFFSDITDEKKKQKIKEKLLQKIEQTRKETRNATTDEEKQNLKAKYYILKKLLERL